MSNKCMYVQQARSCLYGLCVQLSAQGTTRRSIFVSCQPAHPSINQHNNLFSQVLKHFITFISIAINNTYIQVITASIFYFYRAVIGQRWNGPGHRAARAARPYINKCTMKICFIINSMVHSTININVFLRGASDFIFFLF